MHFPILSILTALNSNKTGKDSMPFYVLFPLDVCSIDMHHFHFLWVPTTAFESKYLEVYCLYIYVQLFSTNFPLEISAFNSYINFLDPVWVLFHEVWDMDIDF